MHGGDCAENLLPEGLQGLLIDALNELDGRQDEIIDSFDDLGIAPLGASLKLTDIWDLKTDVFDKLIGSATDRIDWINVTEPIDIHQELADRFVDVTGSNPSDLGISCDYDDTTDKFTLFVEVSGDISDYAPSGTLTPEVTFLPSSFPSLDLDAPTFGISYELNLPLIIYGALGRFVLGETKASLSTKFMTTVEGQLPILADETVSFEGELALDAGLSYSSVSGISASGMFNASLSAGDGGSNALQLLVADSDIFDSNPRKRHTFLSVACSYIQHH